MVAAIRDRAPSVAVIILSMHQGSKRLRELLDAGASAYLAKTVARDQLIASLHSVHRSPNNILLSASRDSFGTAQPTEPELENPLSPRELEVLQLVSEAYSNSQIGRRLNITEGTVKRHLTNIYAKLGAVSRFDCVRKAAAFNFVQNW